MLCIYCLQQWYNLSDPGAQEALYDMQPMCTFAGQELGHDASPDETTNLNFPHLFERHEATTAIRRAHFRRPGVSTRWPSARPAR